MTQQLTTILSIAASDPMGGAGIQQDVRLGNALGAHVVTAITGITVQNSKGFYNIVPVSSQLLRDQLNVIMEDVTPDAIKIGMIGDVYNIDIIATFLMRFNSIPVIIDPVVQSTVNDFSKKKSSVDSSLNEKERMNLQESYKKKLFPLATVITPNLKEFNQIFGEEFNPLKDYSVLCKNLGLNAIIATGGDTSGDEIDDFLISGEEIVTFNHKKKECFNLHGTGCSLSTLLAVELANGEDLKNAFLNASSHMEDIINKSCNYQLGMSKYGPLNVYNYKLHN